MSQPLSDEALDRIFLVYGDPSTIFERLPRPDFEELNQIV